MPNYLLGIDVSTTATKALIIDEQGNVVTVSAVEYSYDTPRLLWSEQDPSLWWNGTVECIHRVMDVLQATPSEIIGVGLTGQMHGMTLLDRHNEVIRPAILWNDQRTAAQCSEIMKIIGPERVIHLTGNPVLTGFTAPKVLWVRENEPEYYERIRKILLPKDYVRYKLTGEFYSEVSDASGTSLFDVGQRRWSDDMLSSLDLAKEWLPEVTESPVVSAYVSSEASRITGLLEGTPVVGGGGDQAAQAIGTGIIAEGTVSTTIGTSGVVFAASQDYRVEPQGRLHAFCHAVPGMWQLMGVMLSAAGSFRWYRDALGQPERATAEITGRDVYDLLTEEAATAPPGCEGLLFLPYLTGERTPYPDPNARGVFFGLTVRHRKPHLTRSVLEGVTYGLLDSLELMRSLGITVQQVRASGGGARSRFWRQLLADIFNSEIVTVNVTEGAAYGAAMLAGVGAEVFPSVPSAVQQCIRLTDQVYPSQDAGIYARYYPLYRDLYRVLKPQFEVLTQIIEGE